MFYWKESSFVCGLLFCIQEDFVRISIEILVSNQLYAQFFMYIYLYSVHVSGSHVPIIGRIIVSMRHLVYVTPCR